MIYTAVYLASTAVGNSRYADTIVNSMVDAININNGGAEEPRNYRIRSSAEGLPVQGLSTSGTMSSALRITAADEIGNSVSAVFGTDFWYTSYYTYLETYKDEQLLNKSSRHEWMALSAFNTMPDVLFTVKIYLRRDGIIATYKIHDATSHVALMLMRLEQPQHELDISTSRRWFLYGKFAGQALTSYYSLYPEKSVTHLSTISPLVELGSFVYSPLMDVQVDKLYVPSASNGHPHYLPRDLLGMPIIQKITGYDAKYVIDNKTYDSAYLAGSELLLMIPAEPII